LLISVAREGFRVHAVGQACDLPAHKERKLQTCATSQFAPIAGVVAASHIMRKL